MINIPEELYTLADIFERKNQKLYIVGGYVRDRLMEEISLEHNDIDICSPVLVTSLKKMLDGSNFSVEIVNKDIGSAIIHGERNYEYTTFRRENYNLNGEHNPTGVEFIKDIRTDALRRDFTINAIYYDIAQRTVVDPIFGLEDLKNKLLKCPVNADTSFKEDAERILRMIRLSCTFNLEIDNKMLLSAFEYAKNVENLSKTRIKKEFDKMLICDTFYPKRKESQYAHAKCMILLGQLDLWKYILPAMDQILHSAVVDEKGEELYSHIINTVSVCDPSVRLSCLLHDVGKLYTKQRKNNFEFSRDWSDIIIENNLGIDGLNYPKKTIEETKRIVKAMDFNNGFVFDRTIRKFIRENFDIFDKICKLKDAIALENTDFKYKSKIALHWKKVYNKMVKNNTPLAVADLDITGGDIIDLEPHINVTQIGKILNYLLDYTLNRPYANKKETLLEISKKYIAKHQEELIED